jgi:Bacterial PH domain
MTVSLRLLRGIMSVCSDLPGGISIKSESASVDVDRVASQAVSVEQVEALGDRGVLYRNPLASILVWVAVTPLALLFLLVATAPILIPVRLVCAALVVALVVMARRNLPVGVEVTRDGVRIADTAGRRSIPWTDIEGFRSCLSGSFRPHESVQVELRAGGLVPTPLIQGRRVRWAAGETRDIVSVLEAALAAAKSRQTREAGIC